MATSTVSDDAPLVRLRVDAWDNRMRDLGFTTVMAQAEAVPCSRSTLHRFRSGQTVPRPSIVRQMARAAQTTPDQLLEVVNA